MITRTVTVISLLAIALCNWLLFRESLRDTPPLYGAVAATWTLAALVFMSWWLFVFGKRFDLYTRLVCAACLLINVGIIALGTVAYVVWSFDSQLVPVRAIVPAVLAWVLIETIATIVLPPVFKLFDEFEEVEEVQQRCAFHRFDSPDHLEVSIVSLSDGKVAVCNQGGMVALMQGSHEQQVRLAYLFAAAPLLKAELELIQDDIAFAEWVDDQEGSKQYDKFIKQYYARIRALLEHAEPHRSSMLS